MSLFDKILTARGLEGDLKSSFLSPNYEINSNPFLLPDMSRAVKRLVLAHKKQEKITIYGDYDIDGLTATAVLVDAFASFGFKNVDTFMPNRFVEGYGLTVDAIESIAGRGTTLCVTVDCGSLSLEPITRANELGMDVIVTDHHTVGDILPPAVAVVNPKRANHKYPFVDLAGVGVAFKLVQALQIEFNKKTLSAHSTGLVLAAGSGLAFGQEKWLLDLVALGTVCDVVSLLGENRTFVYFGLRVLRKAHRPGLKALMAVARIEPNALNARALGFTLGPRMNAAGRLETAQIALDLLLTKNSLKALDLAQKLDEMNYKRRKDQEKIMEEAIIKAEEQIKNPVLVVSSSGWNHGIVGIVAAKLLEKYQKPTFVLEEMGEGSKGSARSYGDFSAVEAVRASEDILISGGGHKAAAGVRLKTTNIDAFRKRVNNFYKSMKLQNQQSLLLPRADVTVKLREVDEKLIEQIGKLEPFGNGNLEPILESEKLLVRSVRKMGDKNQHAKIEVEDDDGAKMQMLAFNAPEHYFVDVGDKIDVMFQPTLNEWQGVKSVEGKILHLEVVDY